MDVTFWAVGPGAPTDMAIHVLRPAQGTDFIESNEAAAKQLGEWIYDHLTVSSSGIILEVLKGRIGPYK